MPQLRREQMLTRDARDGSAMNCLANLSVTPVESIRPCRRSQNNCALNPLMISFRAGNRLKRDRFQNPHDKEKNYGQ